MSINRINVYCCVFLILFIVLLQGCNLSYNPNPNSDIFVEISKQSVLLENIKSSSIKNLDFSSFVNDSVIDMNGGVQSRFFKITRNPNSIANNPFNTLVVMPHYLSEVILLDSDFDVIDKTQRNVYKSERKYSPNINAFDIGNDDVFYALIKNAVDKKIHFSVENHTIVKNYDQKLIITFTAVYSIILTLVFVNLVFFIFIRETSYLYYSLFIFGTLFGMLFHEGSIAYFATLSKPILGPYTQLIWFKLPSIFFWLFIIKFLDLKEKANLDYKLARTMLFLEITVNLVVLILSVFNIEGIYPRISLFLNMFAVIAVLIAVYLPIKYAIIKVNQAIYLAVGWTVYLMAVLMRIYYAATMDSLAFWMPRAFEFGLMFEAIILSFGLADKTMRILKQRDVAEHKSERLNRELFCKELDKNFLKRSNNTIEKSFASQEQLTSIVDTYFVSSLRQLIDVRDVFYAFEYQGKLGIKHLSTTLNDNEIEAYTVQNKTFLNKICTENIAGYSPTPISNENNAPLIVVPIEEKKHDNMCLFLTLPFDDNISDDLIQDLYIFANTMTHSLLTVRKFQKTVFASRFDALTNVLNRKTIDQKLINLISLSQDDDRVIAIAFIDLDDFKFVNDKYGHDAGDECLIFLCDRLKKEFKNNAFVGRFGGDEFVVVLDNYTEKEIVQSIEDIYDYFHNNPIKDIHLSLSIGIAIANKENGLFDDKKLLKAADLALYNAKNSGKNQMMFF